MYSLCCGILVRGEAYHITCLEDEEIFRIFAEDKYTQFSKVETYVSKMYPVITEDQRCKRCGKVI